MDADAASATEPEGRDPLVEFLGGWMGGLCRIPPGHPFDTVKVRMQSGTGAARATMGQTFAAIVREEGMRGLYRGAQSPALGMAALNATLFVSYGHGKSLVDSYGWRRGQHKAGMPYSPAEEYVVGMYAGVFCSLAEGPVDFVKCQLQMRGAEYRGFFHAATAIVRTRGVQGLYQGIVPTMVRNVPAYGLFFSVYTSTLRRLSSPQEHKGSAAQWKVLLAGGAAGAAFWGPTYPVDVVKSRMQADATDPARRRYQTMAHCARAIFAESGCRGFMRGFVPCMVRSVPANAAAWYGYEMTLRLVRYVQ